MPKAPDGHIHIKHAAKLFSVSRSTLDRCRDRARREGDEPTYGMFVLRTKDGQRLRKPAKQRVEELIKEGRVPEWYVDKAWLRRQYGLRTEKPKEGSHQPGDTTESSTAHAALRQQYESRISDLKEQLVAAREEKKDLLQYAQADKQMFAQAAQSLTQVLALPGIVEATKAKEGSAPSVSPIPATQAETVPTSHPSRNTSTTKTLSKKKQAKQRKNTFGWLSWLLN